MLGDKAHENLSGSPSHILNFSERAFIIISVPVWWHRWVFITSACPESWSHPNSLSVQELPCWPGEGPQSRWAAGHLGAHFSPLTSPGSCQVKRQLLEMEAESFVHWPTWDGTKASQVICHLLMGLINGWRVEGVGLQHVATRPSPGSSGWLCYRCIFFSEIYAAFHRFVLLLNAESTYI